MQRTMLTKSAKHCCLLLAVSALPECKKEADTDGSWAVHWERQERKNKNTIDRLI